MRLNSSNSGTNRCPSGAAYPVVVHHHRVHFEWWRRGSVTGRGCRPTGSNRCESLEAVMCNRSTRVCQGTGNSCLRCVNLSDVFPQQFSLVPPFYASADKFIPIRYLSRKLFFSMRYIIQNARERFPLPAPVPQMDAKGKRVHRMASYLCER